VALAVSLLLLSGCGTTSTAGVDPGPSPGQASASPSPASSFSAAMIADPGLPARLGPGKLTMRQVTRLMQYFEDKVADAYSTNRPDELSHYLAGPMLSGNRATILLLTKQHRRNIFRVRVGKVTLQANEHDRIVLDLDAVLTVNYFLDTSGPRPTVVNNGLPGPSHVQFLVFLDRNPGNDTWYWTGEQAAGAGPAAS
jgi:hypothetical protein